MSTNRKYGPPVIKQCLHCKEDYVCPNSRADVSKFCTITCRNKYGAKERITYKCAACSTNFEGRPDHGADRKFCSRKCFLSVCVRPEEKECENCGSLFTATRSSTVTRGDGRRLFCSAKCGAEFRTKIEPRPCANCGATFKPHSIVHHVNQLTCSKKCQTEYYQEARNKNFKGGTFLHSDSNHKMVMLKRPTHVGKYVAEHRIVVMRALKRPLKRTEYVIHINNQPQDNRLSNLYLCETISHYARIRQGSLPWPKKSNIQEKP